MPAVFFSPGDAVVHVDTGKRGTITKIDGPYLDVEMSNGETLERTYDTSFRPLNQEERYDDYMWWGKDELAQYVIELEDQVEELKK